MFRSRQQGSVLCPIRLLRPDDLLCTGSLLLRAVRLLRAAGLLRAGLLRPTATEDQLSYRDDNSTHDRCDLVAPEFGPAAVHSSQSSR
jgi:hypothetical protein